jgi:hypothetical protein
VWGTCRAQTDDALGDFDPDIQIIHDKDDDPFIIT